MIGRAIVSKIIKIKGIEYLEVWEMERKVINTKKVINRSGKTHYEGDTVIYKMSKASIIVQNLLFLVLPIVFFILTFFLLFLNAYSEKDSILLSFLVLALSISFFLILSKTCFKRFFMPYV